MDLPEIYQDQDLYGEQLKYTSPHWQKLQDLIKGKGKLYGLFSLRDVSCKFVPRPHLLYIAPFLYSMERDENVT